jgi:hypothetical protein
LKSDANKDIEIDIDKMGRAAEFIFINDVFKETKE